MTKYLVALFFFFQLSAHAVMPGEQAPDFSVASSNGKTVHLSDYKGKIVVLEWTNPGCPFVKKHYNSGNMQALQKEYTQKGIVWLSLISSAEGKQGFSTPAQAEADRVTRHASPSAILLDANGKVAHLYDAKTTPHMFIVNASGKLVYVGAIDDKASTDMEDVKTAKNYVRAALDELMAGKSVSVANTKSYGCSIKY